MSKLLVRSCPPHALLLLLLLLCAKCLKVTAICNTCNSVTNLACVSTTQFQVCINGLPTGSATSCPTGYICSTASTSICAPSSGQNVVGDCTACNTCDSTLTFACTGVRTYALCLGSATPSDLTGSCEPYHICSIDYEFICGNATEGVTPTCASTETTETTTAVSTTTTTDASIVTNPVTYCQTLQQNGRFPVGNDLTTTCKQYVYCFINNAVWSGALYYCPGATYFDSNTRYCTANVPQRCTSTTQTLSLRDAELDFY
ncbi:uncharacterized protein LOC101457737 isoform X2 [Ceratitis capitata]|uniref:(Mediterranean fruit fly) hypothetical protein n=1 Tax=Ceratitis capitata TaxID=7213 RepID=A0A811UV85_CERCA|nr:uncharacterized protein LOC101457737 isoform X2 [Ceratitis capitata]CAD7002594.1 unnamed protein product [Ceratitis capitata]